MNDTQMVVGRVQRAKRVTAYALDLNAAALMAIAKDSGRYLTGECISIYIFYTLIG
jgi:hypothetical protein